MSEDEISETADTTTEPSVVDNASPAAALSTSSQVDAEIDLDAMAADLDSVDAALVRLADGTYWTDEVTGEPIPTEILEADPMARRA